MFQIYIKAKKVLNIIPNIYQIFFVSQKLINLWTKDNYLKVFSCQSSKTF